MPEVTTPVTAPAVSPQTVPAVSTPAPTAPAGPAPLSIGSTGSDVVTLQNILLLDGYLFAGTFTPGTFDPATLRAVETFQCFEGIACSAATPGYGSVGAKTSAALGD